MSLIVIYGTHDCGWCKKAVQLAEDNKLEYEYIDISKDDSSMNSYRYRFHSMSVPVPKTVPQIFIEYNPFEDEYIGGFEDFSKWYNQQVSSSVGSGDLDGIL